MQTEGLLGGGSGASTTRNFEFDPLAQTAAHRPAFRPGAKILAVLDSDADEEALCPLLDQLGFHASVARNFDDACEELRSEEFDLIIVDLHVRSGALTSCVEYLRDLFPTPPPIVVLVPIGMRRDLRALDPSIRHTMTRPITEGVLVRALAQAWDDGGDQPSTRGALREGGADNWWKPSLSTLHAMAAGDAQKFGTLLASLDLQLRAEMSVLADAVEREHIEDGLAAVRRIGPLSQALGSEAFKNYLGECEDALSASNRTYMHATSFALKTAFSHAAPFLKDPDSV